MGSRFLHRLIFAGITLAAGAGFLIGSGIGSGDGIAVPQRVGIAAAVVMLLWWVWKGRGGAR